MMRFCGLIATFAAASFLCRRVECITSTTTGPLPTTTTTTIPYLDNAACEVTVGANANSVVDCGAAEPDRTVCCLHNDNSVSCVTASNCLAGNGRFPLSNDVCYITESNTASNCSGQDPAFVCCRQVVGGVPEVGCVDVAACRNGIDSDFPPLDTTTTTTVTLDNCISQPWLCDPNTPPGGGGPGGTTTSPQPLDNEACYQTMGPDSGTPFNCTLQEQVCCREQAMAGSTRQEVVCKPADPCSRNNGFYPGGPTLAATTATTTVSQGPTTSPPPLDNEKCFQTSGPDHGTQANCTVNDQVCCLEADMGGIGSRNVVCKPADPCTGSGGFYPGGPTTAPTTTPFNGPTTTAATPATSAPLDNEFCYQTAGPEAGLSANCTQMDQVCCKEAEFEGTQRVVCKPPEPCTTHGGTFPGEGTLTTTTTTVTIPPTNPPPPTFTTTTQGATTTTQPPPLDDELCYETTGPNAGLGSNCSEVQQVCCREAALEGTAFRQVMCKPVEPCENTGGYHRGSPPTTGAPTTSTTTTTTTNDPFATPPPPTVSTTDLRTTLNTTTTTTRTTATMPSIPPPPPPPRTGNFTTVTGPATSSVAPPPLDNEVCFQTSGPEAGTAQNCSASDPAHVCCLEALQHGDASQNVVCKPPDPCIAHGGTFPGATTTSTTTTTTTTTIPGGPPPTQPTTTAAASGTMGPLDNGLCYVTNGPGAGSAVNCTEFDQVCCKERQLEGSPRQDIVCKPSAPCLSNGGYYPGGPTTTTAFTTTTTTAAPYTGPTEPPFTGTTDAPLDNEHCWQTSGPEAGSPFNCSALDPGQVCCFEAPNEGGLRQVICKPPGPCESMGGVHPGYTTVAATTATATATTTAVTASTTTSPPTTSSTVVTLPPIDNEACPQNQGPEAGSITNCSNIGAGQVCCLEALIDGQERGVVCKAADPCTHNNGYYPGGPTTTVTTTTTSTLATTTRVATVTTTGPDFGTTDASLNNEACLQTQGPGAGLLKNCSASEPEQVCCQQAPQPGQESGGVECVPAEPCVDAGGTYPGGPTAGPTSTTTRFVPPMTEPPPPPIGNQTTTSQGPTVPTLPPTLDTTTTTINTTTTTASVAKTALNNYACEQSDGHTTNCIESFPIAVCCGVVQGGAYFVSCSQEALCEVQGGYFEPSTDHECFVTGSTSPSNCTSAEGSAVSIALSFHSV